MNNTKPEVVIFLKVFMPIILLVLQIIIIISYAGKLDGYKFQPVDVDWGKRIRRDGWEGIWAGERDL